MAQLRIPLDATRFSKGMTWKEYVAQMGDTQARTQDNYNRATLTDEERKFFSGVTDVKYILMLAENIAEAMPGAELRVFFRDQNLDLTDCFLNNGFRSIPVVVFFDKDWNEIGRWIERSHPATAKAVGIRAKTLDLAPKDDKAKQDAAMNEFRSQVNAEYAVPGGPLWRAAAQEIKTLLETRAAKK
jgi:hypothetical protein